MEEVEIEEGVQIKKKINYVRDWKCGRDFSFILYIWIMLFLLFFAMGITVYRLGWHPSNEPDQIFLLWSSFCLFATLVFTLFIGLAIKIIQLKNVVNLQIKELEDIKEYYNSPL